MQTSTILPSVISDALDVVFDTAHHLAIGVNNHDLIVEQVGESIILMASKNKTDPIYIDAFDFVDGPLLFASFEHEDWTPEYSAGQWSHSGEHLPAELTERWHELAAFAAAVIDCAQIEIGAIRRLQALSRTEAQQCSLSLR